MKLVEKTLSSEEIYQGDYLKYRKDTVLLPNGKEATRDIIEHPGAVAIVAVTSDNELILVEQYRKAVDMELLEVPAGKLEKNEHPYDCAFRELEEETGYKAKNMKYLCDYHMLPHFSDAKIYFYLADKLTKVEAHRDFDEFINVKLIPMEEAKKRVYKGLFGDAKTAIALMHYFNMLKRGDEVE
jgi:ADP-ribose pyrophosphatase